MSPSYLMPELDKTAPRPAITDYHIQKFLAREGKVRHKKTRESFNLHHRSGQLAIEMESSFENQANRRASESFIQDVFYRCHGARLSVFMPKLLSACDEHGLPYAAVGIRELGNKPVFLEQYLDAPIHKMVSEHAGRIVPRDHIVEVGNLASISAGSSRALIVLLVHYFHDIGVEWAVCTGTSAVRAILKRLKMEYVHIQQADPMRLGEARHSWGTYYQHNPCVIGIDINKAIQLLQYDYTFSRKSL